MADLEVARDDGSVAEQTTGQRLHNLDRRDPAERHRRGAPAQRPVEDGDLLASDHDPRPFPAPDGAHVSGKGCPPTPRMRRQCGLA